MIEAIALLTALLAGLLLGGRWRRGGVPAQEPPAGAESEALARIQAANEERQRIYRDLHDDIGAKLLTLIHSLDDERHADIARAVMQDLRDIVSRSVQAEGSLLEILAQIRDETEQRLATLQLPLHWEQAEDLPDPALDEGQALHLFRIMREAVTNALRHASPRQIRIRARLVAGELLLDVTDDGPGPQPDRRGAGTSAMRRRAQDLHGSIEWNRGTEGGTKVLLRFPLPAA